MKKRNILCAMLMLACAGGLMLLLPELAAARAGGAGGSSDSGSGGGGGDDGLGLLIWLIVRLLLDLPFPWNVIAVAVVIGLYILARRIMRQQTVLNKIPSAVPDKPAGSRQGEKKFAAANASFDAQAVLQKVRTAFMRIQDAWRRQDISGVRVFMSDGVYQRFNTQFAMMKLLKQSNVIENLLIKNVVIDRFDSDGDFDVAHVAIQAAITDRFESAIDPSLNSGGAEEFVEYWSFIRKRGAKQGDLYTGQSCPNCGAGLPASMGALSRCEYCDSVLNSGEFDWVLSEITQAADYATNHSRLASSADISGQVRRLLNEEHDFAVQLIEDKASNAWLQVLTALCYRDPSRVRRFCSDRAYEKVESMLPDYQLAYNRLFLNDVTLLGVQDDGRQNHLAVAIRSSFQRVRIDGHPVHRIDQAVISDTNVVLLVRNKGAAAAGGSLYMHNCPSCGARIEDSGDIACTYCSQPLNSPAAEWILDNILTLAQYREYADRNKDELAVSIDPKYLDKLLDVRDFAFTNVMAIIAADGTLSEGEISFATALAKKLGYDPSRIAATFDQARARRLAIRMPEKPKDRAKVYALMKKAGADGEISAEEQAMLDSVRERYIDGAA
jgi:uncharacterized Zn finger protein (UPF0148 family)